MGRDKQRPWTEHAPWGFGVGSLMNPIRARLFFFTYVETMLNRHMKSHDFSDSVLPPFIICDVDGLLGSSFLARAMWAVLLLLTLIKEARHYYAGRAGIHAKCGLGVTLRFVSRCRVLCHRGRIGVLQTRG